MSAFCTNGLSVATLAGLDATVFLAALGLTRSEISRSFFSHASQ